MKPHTQRRVSNAEVFCPLNDDFGFAFESELTVISPVPGLLALRQPTAIRFTIRTVNVLSFQCELPSGFFSQVSEKVFKKVPASIYCDAPGSVPPIMPIIGVQTPLAHIDPGIVGLGLPHPMPLVVRCGAHTLINSTGLLSMWLRVVPQLNRSPMPAGGGA